MTPDLSLSVQYAADEPRLPRWRLRRWAERALAAAAEDGLVDFSAAELSLPGRRGRGQAPEPRFPRPRLRHQRADLRIRVDLLGVARGDIVICVPVLAREAREQRKDFLHHAAHLTLHGVLHALGYDHVKACDAKRMEALETATLAGMGIMDPYQAD